MTDREKQLDLILRLWRPAHHEVCDRRKPLTEMQLQRLMQANQFESVPDPRPCTCLLDDALKQVNLLTE